MNILHFLLKLLYSGIIAFFFSGAISKFLFEPGQSSYNIAFYGLGLVLLPVYYMRLSDLFASKVVLVDKEAFAAELEKKMKEKMGDEK